MRGLDASKWFSIWAIILTCYAFRTGAQVSIPEIPADIVLSQALNATDETSTPCQQACALLARTGQSVFIGQTGNFEFWDAKQHELVPACRVEPASAEDVAVVLRSLVALRCHFAVKSGGHDRTPGSSNAVDGVTVDLVRLDSIQISVDKRSVTIGAGLRWVDVYRAVEKEDLMVLGGRIGDVGVGGLLLGGGISFYSNEHGLACDSVISYQLVLPNATVITVDQNTQSELYRALRGAGAANFGIVTSFTLEAFSPNNRDGIWSGQKLYPWAEVEQLLEVNHYVATKGMDLDYGIAVMDIFVCHPNHNLCYGVISAHHTSHNDTTRWPDQLSGYGDLVGLPQTLHMGLRSMSNITDALTGSSPSGSYRTIYGTFSYTPSIQLEKEILKIFREEVDSVRNMTGFLPGVIMHPFSRRLISKMHKNGGNMFHSVTKGQTPGTGSLIVVNVAWQWNEKIDDERAYASYHRLMDRMEAVAKEEGVWHPYKYINYAEATQDIWHGYGEEAFAQMQKLQRQIDPKGIFTKDGLAGGFFKLNDLDPSTARGSDQSTKQIRYDRDEL